MLKPAGGGLDRGGFYRLCRMLHGYLSAFAFLALMFFCVTGVLLNHPEWFKHDRPAEKVATLTLTPSELAAAARAKEPGRALAAAVGLRVPLRGAYASSDIADGRALVRLEGPKGTSDLDVELSSGQVTATVAKASFASVIQDLHRGKNSGGAWGWVIDLSAVLLIALSVLGYILFFSLRFRLKTSLMLTAASLAVLLAVALWLVP